MLVSIHMIRFASLSVMGFLFLTISPRLRTELSSCIDSGMNSMSANAPWSWVAFGLVLIVVFLFSLYRGAQAH